MLRQEGVEAAARVNADFDRQTVRIDGRLVSFEYVREMKRDLARDFQVQMGLLGEWLEFGQVADVYTTVMANKGVKVVDNISGRGSVFNVLDEAVLRATACASVIKKKPERNINGAGS